MVKTSLLFLYLLLILCYKSQSPNNEIIQIPDSVRIDHIKPTAFPTYEPTILPTTDKAIFSNDDIPHSPQSDQHLSPESESRYAVYTLLIITMCVIFVIISVLLYKRCLNINSINNGYVTPVINELEEGNESNSEIQEVGGSPPMDGMRIHRMI